MMPPNVSPQSQALAARLEVNQYVLDSNAVENKMLRSKYAEDVRQWVWNKEQHKVGMKLGPIPVPPASWIAVPHINTPVEDLYNASYPGMPPRIDDSQIGPPVAEQFVEFVAAPPPPPGTIVHVGPFLRTENRVMGGIVTAVSLFGCFPDDNMPAGFPVPYAYNGQMILVHKVVNATPWGVAQWYEGVAS